MTMKIAIAFAILAASVTASYAHGGGLNSYGCHTDHKTGLSHCH